MAERRSVDGRGPALWPGNNFQRFGSRWDFSRLENDPANQTTNVVDRRGDDPGRDKFYERHGRIERDPSFMPHEREREHESLNTINFYPEDNAHVEPNSMSMDAGYGDVGRETGPLMDYSGRDPMLDFADEEERESNLWTYDEDQHEPVPEAVGKFDGEQIGVSEDAMAYADGGPVEDEYSYLGTEEELPEGYGEEPPVYTDDGLAEYDAAYPQQQGVLPVDDTGGFGTQPDAYQQSAGQEPEPQPQFPGGVAPHEVLARGAGMVGDALMSAWEYGKNKIMGSQGAMAVEGAETTPSGVFAYLSGQGALDPQRIQQLEQQVDPQGVLDPDTRTALVLEAASRQGGPEGAYGVLQHYRQKHDAYRAFAAAALNGSDQKPPDLMASTRAASQMSAALPDGTNVTFKPNQDGQSVTATVTPRDGRPVDIPMSLQQYHEFLTGNGGQFDNLISKGSAKALGEVVNANRPGRQGLYGDQQPVGRYATQETPSPLNAAMTAEPQANKDRLAAQGALARDQGGTVTDDGTASLPNKAFYRFPADIRPEFQQEAQDAFPMLSQTAQRLQYARKLQQTADAEGGKQEVARITAAGKVDAASVTGDSRVAAARANGEYKALAADIAGKLKASLEDKKEEGRMARAGMASDRARAVAIINQMGQAERTRMHEVTSAINNYRTNRPRASASEINMMVQQQFGTSPQEAAALTRVGDMYSSYLNTLNRGGQGDAQSQAPSAPAPTQAAPAPTGGAEFPAALIPRLKEGKGLVLQNGQVWTLKNGQPTRVK